MLKTQCIVCGTKRKFKTLLYDNQLNAYCLNPLSCSRNHPNNPHMIKDRGGYLEMHSYTDATELQKQRFEYAYEESAHLNNKRIRNISMHSLAKGSISFRVASDIQAEYIAHVLAKIGSNKIGEAIQHCLQSCIEQDTAFLGTRTAYREAYAHTPLKIAEEIDKPREERASQPKAIYREEDEGVFTL